MAAIVQKITHPDLAFTAHPVVDTVGALQIRRTEAAVSSHTGEMSFDTFKENFCAKPLIGYDCRHWKLGFVEWIVPQADSLDFTTIGQELEAPGIVFCVGRGEPVPGTDNTKIIGMFRKLNYSTFKSTLQIGGLAPTGTYTVNILHGHLMADHVSGVMQNFVNCLRGSFVSTMVLSQPDDNEFSCEDAFALVKDLTPAELLMLIGKCKSTSKDHLSTFGYTVLKCKDELKALHRNHCDEQVDDNSNHPMIVLVRNPWRKMFQKEDFQNLDQLIGERLDETTGETVTCSFAEYCRDPEKHMVHAALVYGGNDTTGYGKTSMVDLAAYTLAREYASHFHIDDPYYVYTRSVEGLKRVQSDLLSGVPIVFDECNMSDTTQIQYLSEDGLKQLLDVTSTADLRARNDNVFIHPSQPRFITANASDLQAWLGERATVCAPVLRRFWTFKVAQRYLKTTAIDAAKVSRTKQFATVAGRLAGVF